MKEITIKINKCLDCPNFIRDYGEHENHKCKKIYNLFWNCLNEIDYRCPYLKQLKEN